MSSQRFLFIASVLTALLFGFGVFGIPIGLGAFLFFNALLLMAYFGSREIVLEYTDEESKELSQKLKDQNTLQVLKVFAIFYIALTFTYLYRLDMFAIAPVFLFHLGFIVYFSIFMLAPKLLTIMDPITVAIGSMAAGVQWIASFFESIGLVFRNDLSKVKVIGKLIFYGVISLAIFIIFALLLSQADAQFAKIISQIFDTIRLNEIVFRGTLVLGSFLVVFSFFAVLLKKKIIPLVGLTQRYMDILLERVSETKMLRNTESFFALVVLIPVIGLFGLYMAVQYRYLFSVNISDITVISEYARRGFFELLVVTGLTYPLVAWVTNRSRTTSNGVRYISFTATSLTVLLIGTVLYSALYKMGLYMELYGPTLYRMYVLVGIVIIALLMLAYLIISFIKTIRPGISYVKSLFFGDFVLMGMFSGVLLLTIISLFPWNSLVFVQVTSWYKETGKLDIRVIKSFAEEAPYAVLVFANEQKNSVPFGSQLIKTELEAIKEREQASYNESIFSNFFGLNFSRFLLLNIDTGVIDKNASVESMNREIDSLVVNYLQAIQRNDFTKARTFIDSTMVATNLVKFNRTAGIGFDLDSIKSYRSNPSLELNVVYPIDYDSAYVSYAIPVTYVLGNAINTRDSTGMYGTKESFLVNVGFRNGKPQIIGSSLELAYLPDAIVPSDNNTLRRNLSDKGYSTYCVLPNGKNLFRKDNDGCNVYSQTTQWFTEDDFLLE